MFSEGVGRRLCDIKARISLLKSNSKPWFWKASPVALARRPLVEKELEKMAKEGIIKAVPHREWAAPIVTPLTKDGTVRICGNFKIKVNPQADVDK